MLANPARKLIGSRNTTYQGFVHRNTVRDIPRFPISLRSYPADSPLVEKDRQREREREGGEKEREETRTTRLLAA